MKPLILDYAIQRKGIVNTLYKYDFKRSLNVIIVDNEMKTFIDATGEDLSFLTETRVQGESNDDNLNIQEMGTLTEVRHERDTDWCSLMELKTKTLSTSERDDESFDNIQ